jgi:uncharacterized protein
MAHQPNNIFAGTQVVALVEVRGTNNSLVHPRGAVGVVTRTPTGDQDQFFVRFPDGFEASLAREKLEVLKHFKDRLPGADTTPDFELEEFIIYRCVVSSRAYGLDHDDSDTDRRGIYLAPADLQCHINADLIRRSNGAALLRASSCSQMRSTRQPFFRSVRVTI